MTAAFPVPPLSQALPAPRLAVVEDDPELREQILLPAMAAAGFAVAGFPHALDLYREWTRAPFDLVLLDVGLPDEDGVEIARHLRSLSSSVGIVVYSGQSSGADRLRGLRAGVDVYLAKPVEVDEIVETLRNLARRVPEPRAAAPGASGWVVKHRGWMLVTPSGTSITLSRSEREIVVALVERLGQVVARETLVERLTGNAGEFDPHRLDTLVYRLRRKCEAAGHPLPLGTVRGAGYQLDW